MLSDTESIYIGALIHIKQDALIRILILKLDFLSGINLRQRRILTGAKKVPLQKIAFFICYRICFSGIPTASMTIIGTTGRPRPRRMPAQQWLNASRQ